MGSLAGTGSQGWSLPVSRPMSPGTFVACVHIPNCNPRLTATLHHGAPAFGVTAMVCARPRRRLATHDDGVANAEVPTSSVQNACNQ
jgi:hypothetical protein